jgi:prepilin-type N-terminal cleavage/methylation domain-containing protein
MNGMGLVKLQGNRRGFTLIELMIVVVIISLLAALAVPRFTRASGKAKKSEAKTILKQIYQLERAYYLEHDRYIGAPNTAALAASNLGFEDPGADARYDYSVLVAVAMMAAGGSVFIATATETNDADGDGIPNERLTMNQNGIEGGDWY